MNDYSKIWHAAKKIVYSTSLSDVTTANTTLERTFDAEAVRKMVSESDKDVDIGGPHLAAHAIKANIIDDYHQIIAPLILGEGNFWLPGGNRNQLELIDMREFENGFVHLHYRKAGGKEAVDYEIVEFMDQAAFRAWLADNAGKVPGIWLKIYKKNSGVTSITYAKALDEALCYGWIDGQKKGYDELSFLQKFTPRRPKSMWSKRNIENVERLTKSGLMTMAGLQEVQKAKADGRWEQAYDKPRDMEVPNFFLEMLRQHPKAEEFYKTLNKANTYAIAWRLQTAKTEATRLKRAEKLIAMLDAGQKLR